MLKLRIIADVKIPRRPGSIAKKPVKEPLKYLKVQGLGFMVSGDLVSSVIRK